MFFPSRLRPACILVMAAATWSGAFAQAKPPAAAEPAENQQANDDGPIPTPLSVGALQIASDANLAVDAIDISVATDRIGYTYKLRNKGTLPLDLSASIAMPDLETSEDGRAVYELPTPSPDNPVGLTVQAGQAIVPTTASIQAVALGLDHLADLKAEHIPLVPFSADAEKALAAATPATLSKLARTGLVSPREPSQADAPVVADWSLHVTHGWTQRLNAGSSTLSIAFAPIKATYTADKDSLVAFEDLKDQICLTPKIMAGLQALLKTKTATFDVADILVASDKPTRWIDSPAITIQVRKPRPSSVAVFCGADAASAAQLIAKGTVGDGDANEGLRVRVMIFTPASP